MVNRELFTPRSKVTLSSYRQEDRKDFGKGFYHRLARTVLPKKLVDSHLRGPKHPREEVEYFLSHQSGDYQRIMVDGEIAGLAVFSGEKVHLLVVKDKYQHLQQEVMDVVQPKLHDLAVKVRRTVVSSAWDSRFDSYVSIGKELAEGYAGRILFNETYLDQCLTRMDEVTEDSDIAVGVFFHRAVYKPGSFANYHNSADKVWQKMKVMGLENPEIPAAIIAMSTHVPPFSEQGNLLWDLNRTVFTLEREEYREHAINLRQVYRSVPKDEYCAGRSGTLQALLDRPLFISSQLAKYEDTGRANLEWEMGILKKEE
jgi:predicted metal-dependent HD superfamily phosphohydrolase